MAAVGQAGQAIGLAQSLQRLIGSLQCLLLLQNLRMADGQPLGQAAVLAQRQIGSQGQQQCNQTGSQQHSALAALGHIALDQLALADFVRFNGLGGVHGRQVAVKRGNEALVLRLAAEIKTVGAWKFVQGLDNFQIEQLMAVTLFGKEAFVEHHHVHRAIAQRLEKPLVNHRRIKAVQLSGRDDVLKHRLQRHAAHKTHPVPRQIGTAGNQHTPPFERNDGVVAFVMGRCEQAFACALWREAQRHQPICAAVLYLLDFFGNGQVWHSGDEGKAQAHLLRHKAQHVCADAGVGATLLVIARQRRGVAGKDAQRRHGAKFGALLCAQCHWRVQTDAFCAVTGHGHGGDGRDTAHQQTQCNPGAAQQGPRRGHFCY